MEPVCDICGLERDQAHIAEKSKDVSPAFGEKPGTMIQRLRYCNDIPSCVEEAEKFSFWGDPPSI